jgi:hypothetical protein
MPSPALSFEAERAAARQILREECGSGGDSGRLREAMRLAKTGWRDLLVAAVFAERADAHLEPFKRR